MKRWHIATILLIINTIVSFSCPGSIKYHVIVDTDCAIDDFRAITMLMALDEVEIEAFIVSEGSLDIAGGFDMLTRIRHFFEKNGIPIAVGKTINIYPPAWRELNREFSWGEELAGTFLKKQVNEVIPDILKNSEEKVIYLALGPFSNLSEILKNDTLKERIEKVLWYCSGFPQNPGFNHISDKQAADEALVSGIEI